MRPDDIAAEKAILDGEEILLYAKNHSLDITITNFKTAKSCPTILQVIHTGEEKNKTNGGINNHWIAGVGDHIFDSLGYFRVYKIDGGGFKELRTSPKRMQSIGTNVCGEYVLLFLKEASLMYKTHSIEEILKHFKAKYNISHDTIKNDENILEAFRESDASNITT
jgi:hypothetical protein